MSNLTRWDPFREMMSLRNAMDCMFDNAIFGSQAGWFRPMTWDLAMDVLEKEDEYLVKASLPGISSDDLEITYNADMLTIKGEVKEEKDVKEHRYHLRERRYGSFSRSVALPSTIKADAIEAIYESGVLTLHLPKAEEAKPKRIQVHVGESTKLIEGKATDIKTKN